MWRTILGCTLAASALADAGKPVPKSVTEKELAARLELYRGITRLEVSFKQTKYMKDMDLKLASEGHLSLQRPDQVDWRIDRPSPLLVKLGGGRIHIESGSGADKSVQDFQLSAMPDDRASRAMAGLVAWLQLDAHAIAAQYRIFATGPRTMRFLPVKATEPGDSPFDSLEMKLAPDGHLEHLGIEEASKDRLDIDFGKPKLQ